MQNYILNMWFHDNKNWLDADHREYLETLSEEFSYITDWNVANISKVIKEYAKRENYDMTSIYHILRLAIAYRSDVPSIVKIMECLGKEKVLDRIKGLLEANNLKGCKRSNVPFGYDPKYYDIIQEITKRSNTLVEVTDHFAFLYLEAVYE